MTRESVMSTPIFDELLREMAQRAEPRPSSTQPAEAEHRGTSAEQARAAGRRRRAD